MNVVNVNNVPDYLIEEFPHEFFWYCGAMLEKMMNLLHCVYFQFIIEGMEECASEGLDDLVHSRKDTFLKVKCQYLLSNSHRVM